jgi:cyclic pyranopterin phosphate synthase
MGSSNKNLIDPFGRHIDYVRLSVTDRCDFRCVYCMAEEMTFLPRANILTLEEMSLIAQAFVNLGVRKIRLTGGEPLIRNNAMQLVSAIGQLNGLDELTLTTNGSQLTKYAEQLKSSGVKRINISLDSLNADRFKAITRTGDLNQVLQGIDSALAQQFQRIKINTVILKGRNDDEIIDLVTFIRDKGLDISFIEEMPLGLIDKNARELRFCPGDEIRELIHSHFPLSPIDAQTGGPSRYYSMTDSDSKVGFILPYSQNFCHLCNRVRVTAEGLLLLCLGNEHSADLKAILREHPGQLEPLEQAIIAAINNKPEQHHFDSQDEAQIVRFMNMTGG